MGELVVRPRRSAQAIFDEARHWAKAAGRDGATANVDVKLMQAEAQKIERTVFCAKIKRAASDADSMSKSLDRAFKALDREFLKAKEKADRVELKRKGWEGDPQLAEASKAARREQQEIFKRRNRAGQAAAEWGSLTLQLRGLLVKQERTWRQSERVRA